MMIIGDLDLDWAEQDPDYLARVKAFLVSDLPRVDTAAASSRNAAIAAAMTADDNASELALD